VRRKQAPNTRLSEQYEEKKKSVLPRTVAFSLADEIAGGQFHYKNFLVKELKEKFSDSHNMWHVEKMYPYCDKGILHVDEPTSLQEIELCILKNKFMKEKNLRYVFITREMDLVDCLKELGDLI
jgi:hypothetical protein